MTVIEGYFLFDDYLIASFKNHTDFKNYFLTVWKDGALDNLLCSYENLRSITQNPYKEPTKWLFVPVIRALSIWDMRILGPAILANQWTSGSLSNLTVSQKIRWKAIVDDTNIDSTYIHTHT